MSDTDRVKEAVSGYLNQVSRNSLKTLLFDVVEPEDLDEYLARLSYHVAPSYLPWATFDGGMLVVHLWPGGVLEEAPILYVPTDKQEARFVCDRQANLPQALLLWVGGYFENRPAVLRQAIDSVTNSIPGAEPVSDTIWSMLQHRPVWWLVGSDEYTDQAWNIAGVGHPFAGAPRLPRRMDPNEALSVLEPFVASRPDVPELLSVLLAIQAKLGLPRTRKNVLDVLFAEGWRELDCVLSGGWRMRGEGMCEWDCTLSNLEDPEATLGDSPFRALIGNPETYSGKDRGAPMTLMDVARAFNEAGDKEGELRQTRNAATLAVLKFGEFPEALARKIAEICDSIEPDSLAGGVAREVARVHEQGP